jgi:hypothetical protein
MKISVDIKAASAVLYFSVVFRQNLVANGCKLQAVVYFLQLQFPLKQKPNLDPRVRQWAVHFKSFTGKAVFLTHIFPTLRERSAIEHNLE